MTNQKQIEMRQFSTGTEKLYVRLASLLRRNIRDSIWRPGQQIPSLETIAKDFDVSLVTVRQSVILLEQEGLLNRVQGKGTYVTHTAGVREWLRLGTTWDDILKFYDGAQTKIDNRNLEKSKIASLPVNMHVNSKCMHATLYKFLRRVHHLDDFPYALSKVYISNEIFELKPQQFETSLALKVIDGISPPVVKEAYQLLMITNADSEVSRNLNIQPGSTVAEVHRSIINYSNTLVYYSIMYYRGDLVQIESRLK